MNAFTQILRTALDGFDQVKKAEIFFKRMGVVRSAVGLCQEFVVRTQTANAMHLAHLPQAVNAD